MPRIRPLLPLSLLLAAVMCRAAPTASTPRVPASSPASPLPASSPPRPADQGGRFAALEHAYVVYSLGRFPVEGTYLGGSGFDPALAGVDGTLRDYSPAGIAAEDAHLRMLRAGFAAFEPRGLSPRRRIDRSVALAQIDFLLHQHEVLRHQQVSLDSYVDEPFRGVDWQLQGMTAVEGGLGTEAEWRLLLARVRAIPTYLDVAGSQLDAGARAGRVPDWRVLVMFGLGSTAADAEYFEHTLPGLAAQRLRGGARAELLKELGGASHDAAAAYLRLRDHVAASYFLDPHGRDVQALKPQFRADRFALGEAEYDWALHNNLRLGTTAAALYAQSWPVVQDTRAQLIQLARSIAAAHGWSAPGGGEAAVRLVFSKLRERAPASDADMVAAYRRLAVRLVDYARSTHLFDVPADYRLDVTVTPPPLRSAIEGAAYYPAPVFKATGVGRFYVTPTGDDEAALREQHNYAEMPDLAAHEGFPGHDWHYKVMTANKALISPIRWLTPGAVEDSSSMWEDSLAAEGWALYSEALLAEPQPGAPHGFYSPEEHLYQLRGQLYRDLRVRIDTGLHTGKLSFEDAVTLFSEVVDFLPGSCSASAAPADDIKRASCAEARGAVTRYARWPTQAITYRLGKEQILALRRRAQRLYGADFSEQRFHLEFMRQGTVPAGYFAEELLRALGRP